MPRVLIIEDSVDARTLYRKGLEEEGYEVSEASDGLHAFELLSQGLRPDLVLLDLTMPGLSGQEFHAKLRSSEELQGIKTLIVSGLDDIRTVAKEIGADGFLRKPFDLYKFFSEVARCLES